MESLKRNLRFLGACLVIIVVAAAFAAWLNTNQPQLSVNAEQSEAPMLQPVPKPMSYGSDAAVPEPFPPTWVLEQPDGSFACRQAGIVLADGEVRGADWTGHYRMVDWLHQEPQTAVDFVDGVDRALGLIVGGTQFAEIPASLQGVDTSTLLVQQQYFAKFDQGIQVCLQI